MNQRRSEVQAPQTLFEARRITQIAGSANGLRVPSVQLLLALSVRGERSRETLHRAIRAFGLVLGDASASPDGTTGAATQPTLMRLCHGWSGVLSRALAEVNPALAETVCGPLNLQEVNITKAGSAQKATGVLLQWPTHWPHLLAPVLNWALDLWLALAQATDQDLTLQTVRASWEQLKPRLGQALPSGTNAALLLTAADSLKLPALWIEKEIVQLGQGRRSRLLRSTMTDATPGLGTMLARDKVRTNRFLRMAGVPVPQHEEVSSEEGALAAAERLGWPVVVKPADQDGGNGARANLQDPEHVTAAYRYARKSSNRILVERYIAGQDHRLTVVHGQLFWAHSVQRALVVGDGRTALRALIDIENGHRRQAQAQAQALRGNSLSQIRLKDDDVQFLEENGFPLDCIPSAGEEILLQRIPSSRTGGRVRAFFDDVHPDNRLLAERVAQILRLDVAGVDFITPDITRSWREVGGVITEVNVIPQIYNTTDRKQFARLLRHLLPGQGRVPLAFVLASGTVPNWVELVHGRLSEAGLRTGLSTEAGLRIGSDWIRIGRSSVWDDVQAMQMDPTVGAMLVVGDGTSFLQTGLPFDAVDALVVAAPAPQVLQLLMPYCGAFKAVLGQQVANSYGNMLKGLGSDWLVLPDDQIGHQQLVEKVVAALLKAEAGYAQADPILPDPVQ